MAKPLITVMVPMYNEEPVLPLLFAELNKVTAKLKNYNFEYLFIDDGSKDASLSIVKNFARNDKRVRYVGLSRNFGKERALLAGFDHINSDATIIIDADLQDPPRLFGEMLKLWREGYQDVYAQRTSRAGESWVKRVTSHMYYRILQKTTRIEIQPDTGDFRLLDRVCIEALQEFRETERNTKAMFSWIGFRKIALPYDRDARAAGKTKFNYWKLLNLAIDGITSFTTTPLRISAIIGFIVSLFAFGYLLFIVIKGIITGSDVSGYPSTMATILFLGGVQLISLGIIGEYIGKVFNETKHRPAYLIGDTNTGHPHTGTSHSGVRHVARTTRHPRTTRVAK